MNDNNPHPSDVYFAPPWKQDGRKSELMHKYIRRIHEGLKHPEKETIRRLIWKLHDGEQIPKETTDSINNLRCTPYATTPELPGHPKQSLPAEATPNITVSLDVMSHQVKNHQHEILVMLYHGDMFLKIKRISNRSAETAFKAFYSRWISFFDSPLHVIVDRGSNLSAQLMRDKLSTV